MIWHVLLDGSSADSNRVIQQFTASGFGFDQIDGKFALTAPSIEFAGDKEDVISAAMELVTAINISLRLSTPGFRGLGFWGLVEKRGDGSVHRTMLAEGGSYGIQGVAAVGLAGHIGKPKRSKEERLTSLMRMNDAIADIANGMTAYPLTWGALSKTYESVKGLVSDKANTAERRGDHEGLIKRGWITAAESESFYHTAAHHRHGYPKSPIRGDNAMDHTTACILIKRLFWQLVDEMEPI